MKQLRLIKLTARHNGKPFFLNVDMIGDIIDKDGVIEYGKVKPRYTIVGHLTHNNGGFEVLETPEEILKLINECKPI
jgi:hypothetical protein